MNFLRPFKPFEEYLDYISEYKKDFRAQIQGATEEEIAKLESVVGQPLPNFYKSFLQYMGHDTGEVDLFHLASSDITDILEYYETEGCAELIPSDCILIATGDFDIGLQITGTGEPAIVSMDNPNILYAGSLKKFLFQNVFTTCYMKKFPHDAFFTSSYNSIGRRHRVAEARELCLRSGFTEQWFSDSNSFCGEKDNACIYIHQIDGQGLAIIIYATLISDLFKWGRLFVWELDVDLVL
jgi:hypothetical protein